MTPVAPMAKCPHCGKFSNLKMHTNGATQTPTDKAVASVRAKMKTFKAAPEGSPAEEKTESKGFERKEDPKPNAKAPLGSGGRFAALKTKLTHKPGITNPGALAASIGRKKYGASKMASMAANGR